MSQPPSEQDAATAPDTRVDSSLLSLLATALWLLQGLRYGVGGDELSASSLFGWGALAVAGFTLGVGLPRALPSVFNRRPDLQRSREQRVSFLVRGLVVLGFTSHLATVPEWGPTWELVAAAVTFLGGVVLSGALPKASTAP